MELNPTDDRSQMEWLQAFIYVDVAEIALAWSINRKRARLVLPKGLPRTPVIAAVSLALDQNLRLVLFRHEAGTSSTCSSRAYL